MRRLPAFAPADVPAALALLAAVAALAVLAGPAGAQQPTPTAPVTVDGPSSDITALSGLSIARDGTGGLVYLKNVSGRPQVFVSRLLGGTFQPPEQIDASLGGPSSQPVIAAGNGGLLLIAFINGAQVYVVDRLSSTAAYTAPLALGPGASDPSLALSSFGKGYLAFTAADNGAHDVRAAYYYKGQWTLVAAPLDAVPADDAGTGSGRPKVAAAGDGVGIFTWGEAGHIYTRRVWGTSPSVVFEQADVPSLSGWSEVTADQPAIGSGGDSSYADVVFHELLTNGSRQQSRVLMRRLRGSQYETVTQPDDLTTPGAEGADQPQLAMTEYGHGLVTSARDSTNALFGAVLGDNGSFVGLIRVDSLQNTTPPFALPATAGLLSDLVAWQQNPGTAGTPEIRMRYATDGATLGPELVLSSPLAGPAEAANGLFAGGDIDGDALVAWVQGTGSATQIVADTLYQAPGSIGVVNSFQYSRTAQPMLVWTPARERWGTISYRVSFDSAQIAQTSATSLELPSPVPDGPHTWQVTAVNPAGLSSSTRQATVWVDTVPPAVTLTLTGRQRAGSVVHVYVAYTDAPPPEPPAAASGIASVVVNWGDGSSYTISHGKFHVYAHAGQYRLTVTVTDRAGNATTVTQPVTIAPKPKPKPKPKRKTKPKPRRR